MRLCARRRSSVWHCNMDGMGSVLAGGAPLYAPQAQLPGDCYHSDQAALALGATAAGQLDFRDTAPVYTTDGLFLPTKVCGRAAQCMQELPGAGCSRVLPAACPNAHLWLRLCVRGLACCLFF